MSSASLRVVAAGWGTTVQDHGRPGLAHLGVPTSGAVDREAHDRSNRLVGNPPDAATIETRGGLVIEALRPVVAATSADGQRHTLQAGDTVRIDPADGQMWAYLAVRGGIEIEPVLGSRSTDTLSGLGPAPIAAGDGGPCRRRSGHRTRGRAGTGPRRRNRQCGCGQRRARCGSAAVGTPWCRAGGW